MNMQLIFGNISEAHSCRLLYVNADFIVSGVEAKFVGLAELVSYC